MALFAYLYLYLVVALLMGGFAYYREVMHRRDSILFTFEHRAILAFSAGLVGLLWALFLPATLIWQAVQWRRSLANAHRPIHLPAAVEARAGG